MCRYICHIHRDDVVAVHKRIRWNENSVGLLRIAFFSFDIFARGSGFEKSHPKRTRTRRTKNHTRTTALLLLLSMLPGLKYFIFYWARNARHISILQHTQTSYIHRQAEHTAFVVVRNKFCLRSFPFSFFVICENKIKRSISSNGSDGSDGGGINCTSSKQNERTQTGENERNKYQKQPVWSLRFREKRCDAHINLLT